MGNLYGGRLIIEDAFSNVFSKFSNSLNNLGNKFSNFAKKNKSETDENIKSTEEYRRAVMKLASEYKKMGMSASDALKKAHKELEHMKSQISSTSSKSSKNNLFGSFNTDIVDKFSSKLNSMVGKFIAMQTASKGIQKMFESGMEFQNARMFLNQAFGSEESGQEKFKFAQKFASETPFDTKEVANALARAKMLNLGTSESDFKMYSDLGSLAKLTGTGDLSSAIDAISDMQQGEWERLQTILGIKRSTLEDYAKTNGLGTFTNKKGQVTDVSTLMNVFKAYIDDKGITGMTEKFGETFQGRLGALGDQMRQTLASLGGIDANGNVEKGGLFDIAGRNLEKSMKALERFSKSQSFDKVKQILEDLGTGIEKGIDYLVAHPEAIDRLLDLGKAFVGLKVVTSLISPFTQLSSVLGGLPSLIQGITNTNIPKNNIPTGGSIGAAGKVVAGATLAVGATSSLYKTDGFIHKLGNNLNPANWFAKDGEKEDYLAQIFGYSTKAAIWGMNKLGFADDNQANKAYSNVDKYVQNANDYINGRTDKVVDMGNMSASPTIQVNIDKVEKEVDMDTVLMKIANIFNKQNNVRNAIV